jgi:hypothetical protein
MRQIKKKKDGYLWRIHLDLDTDTRFCPNAYCNIAVIDPWATRQTRRSNRYPSSTSIAGGKPRLPRDMSRRGTEPLLVSLARHRNRETIEA